MKKKKKSKAIPVKGREGHIGLSDVEHLTLSRQSVHSWRLVWQPYSLAALYPQNLLVLISVRGWVNPGVMVRLEGLGALKKSMISYGVEPATFLFVA
jgi:hypothetical protein